MKQKGKSFIDADEATRDLPIPRNLSGLSEDNRPTDMGIFCRWDSEEHLILG